MSAAHPIDPLILPALLYALSLLAVLVGIVAVTVLWSRWKRRQGGATDTTRASGPDHGDAAGDDEEDPAYVRYLDPETNRVVRIPAIELAPGSVLARVQGHEHPVWISAAALEPSPVRHPPFAEDVRERVRQIQRAFERVRPMSVEQWEDGFRRDLHPEREIALFLYAGAVLHRMVEQGVGDGTAAAEQEIYRVLVACMTGSPQHVRHLVGQTSLTRQEVRRIADAFYLGAPGGGDAR